MEEEDGRTVLGTLTQLDYCTWLRDLYHSPSKQVATVHLYKSFHTSLLGCPCQRALPRILHPVYLAVKSKAPKSECGEERHLLSLG